MATKLEETIADFHLRTQSRYQVDTSAVHPYYESVANLVLTHVQSPQVMSKLAESAGPSEMRKLIFADVLLEYGANSGKIHRQIAANASLDELMLTYRQVPFKKKCAYIAAGFFLFPAIAVGTAYVMHML
jgi:hypothetical protein